MTTETNNPLNLPNGHFTAHIGLYVDFSNYFGAYQEAAEILFQAVAKTDKTPDSIALPLLFLMRHSLELGYKFTLDSVLRNDGQFYSPGSDGHSLTSCHKTLRKWFDEMCKRNNVPENLKEDFDKYYDLARIGMEQLDHFDPDSYHFRYPGDKKGQSSYFNRNDKVNLLEIKRAYDGAMTLLRHTADVFARG
jgi:hypothetical protein